MTEDALKNPLREGLRALRIPDPNTIVIFGATGDLTQRKLVPALYHLELENFLPASFNIVGFARRPKAHDDFRREMYQAVMLHSRTKPVQEAVWKSFSEGIFYHQSEFEDRAGYVRLAEFLDALDKQRGTAGNRVYYLATPPNYYPAIIDNLGVAGLARTPRGWARLIIEKPFGRDLTTAQALNRTVHQSFEEEQVYRIDHYLGKETVQNILVFRFANGIFEPIWNRRYIDHVQITVAENLGVEGRGGYYETAGVMRDMIQNHVLQLLTLMAMEPPIDFEANAVRDEKVKVLRAVRPIHPEEVDQFTVRGQYSAGVLSGKAVPGYLSEKDVKPDSTTETYVALKLTIDNWRWAGVPVYLRSGKRLPKRTTEIAIYFRAAPLPLFGEQGAQSSALEANILALRIQPDEGITLRFGSKVPGPTVQIRPVNMDFRYGTSFGVQSAEAYERLILDCMLGDSTLFTRRDEVEAAWTFVTRILEGWQQHRQKKLPQYEAGSWGPREAEEFIGRDGRRWRRL